MNAYHAIFGNKAFYLASVYKNTTHSHTQKQDDIDTKRTRKGGRGINRKPKLSAKTSRESKSNKKLFVN